MNMRNAQGIGSVLGAVALVVGGCQGELAADPELAAAARSAPVDDPDWAGIPAVSMRDYLKLKLWDFETTQAFSRGMGHDHPLSRCVKEWRAPKGVTQVESQMELRVVVEDGVLVVKDAIVTQSNPSSAELDRCWIASLVGRRVPAPNLPNGARYRAPWGVLAGTR